METEVKNTPQAEENSVTNPSTQAAENKESPLHENPRFKEIIGQRNQAREENAKYQAAEKATEEKLLQDKGEFTTILAKRDAHIETLTTDNEAYKKKELAESERLDAKIPEEQRVFTNGMNNAVKAKFIEQLQGNANAGKTDSSRAGNTAVGDFGGYSSHAEWATKDPQGYKQANMTPDAHGIKIGYGGI
tara:strand:- start:392 stop:961 length:570 start_codon:yes stop_codon:yes gene_type:complete